MEACHGCEVDFESFVIFYLYVFLVMFIFSFVCVCVCMFVFVFSTDINCCIFMQVLHWYGDDSCGHEARSFANALIVEYALYSHAYYDEQSGVAAFAESYAPNGCYQEG